jgi:hypothetical protein
MGRQSARIFYNNKDHKEVFFNGNYHNAIFMNGKIVWQKLAGSLDTNIPVSEKEIRFSPRCIPNHLFMKQRVSMGRPQIFYSYDITDTVEETGHYMETMAEETYSGGYFYFNMVDTTDNEYKVWYTQDHVAYHRFPYYLSFVEPYGSTTTTKTYEFRIMGEQDYAWYIETTRYTDTRNILQCKVVGNSVTVINRFKYDPNVSPPNIYGLGMEIDNHIVIEQSGKYYMFYEGFIYPTDISDFLETYTARFVDADYIYGIKTVGQVTTIERISKMGIRELVAEINDRRFFQGGVIKDGKYYYPSANSKRIFIYNFSNHEITDIPCPLVGTTNLFFYNNGKFDFMYAREGNLLSILEVEV